MKPHEKQLLLIYSSGAIISSLLVKTDILTPEFIQLGGTFIWCGFILAISLMEAWVKFKSPLLRKHIAINVGLNVFSSLHTEECALAGTIWLMYFFDQNIQQIIDIFNNNGGLILSILTILLVFQMAVISPKLNLRGYKVQLDAFKGWREEVQKNSGFLSVKEVQYLRDIEQLVEGKQIPSNSWHLVYGVIEVVKCGMLFTLAGQFYS